MNKLNTIPIIVYEEEESSIKRFFDLNKFYKPFRQLPRIKRTERIREIFQQRSVVEFGPAVDRVAKFSGPEYERLEKEGFAMMREQFQTDSKIH